MKKQLTAWLLALVMLFSLVGCGALIGAVMAAGSVTDGKGTPRTARSILTSFQEKSGATICKDLKGVETGKVLCPCAQCVRNAVLAAGEMLGE